MVQQQHPFAGKTAKQVTQTALNIFQSYDSNPQKAIAAAGQMKAALHDLRSAGLTDPSAPGSHSLGAWADSQIREIDFELARRDGTLDKLRAGQKQMDAEINALSAKLQPQRVGRDVPPLAMPDLERERISTELETKRTQKSELDRRLSGLTSGLQGYFREGSLNPLRLLPGGVPFGEGTTVSRVVTKTGFWTGIPTDAYLLPEEIANHPIDATTVDMARRSEILNGGVVEQGTDGKRRLVTGFGDLPMEDYDAIWENRDSLRKSVLGMDPNAWLPGGIYKGSLGDSLTNIASKALLPEGQVIDRFLIDVPTADPRFTLPYLPDLFGDGDMNRAWRTLQDPVGLATVRHAIQSMIAEGELEPSFWESVTQVGMGFGEFILTNAAVGGAAKMTVGKLFPAAPQGTQLATEAARKRPVMTLLGDTVRKGLGTAGYESGSRYWRGLQFGVRDIMEESVDATVHAMLSGDENFFDAMLSGAGEGISEFMVYRGIVRPTRLLAGKSLTGLRKMSGDIVGGMWAGNVEAGLRRLNKAPNAVHQTVIDRISSLPSKRIDLDKAIRQIVNDPKIAQDVGRVLDASLVGMTFGAWEEAIAESGAEWDGLSAGEKLDAVFSNLGSKRALASASFYMAAGGLQAGATHGRALFGNLNEEQQAAVRDIAKQVVREFAEPTSRWQTQEYLSAFEDLAAANPQYTEGVRFYDRAEQRTPQESAHYDRLREEQGVRSAELEEAQLTQIRSQWSPARIVKHKPVEQGGELAGAEVEWRTVDQDDGAFRLYAPVELEGETTVPYFIKEIEDGQYAVVHLEDPSTQVKNTNLWSSPEGAMAQAFAVATGKGRKRNKVKDVTPEPVEETQTEALTQATLDAKWGDPDMVGLTPIEILQRSGNFETEAEALRFRAQIQPPDPAGFRKKDGSSYTVDRLASARDADSGGRNLARAGMEAQRAAEILRRAGIVEGGPATRSTQAAIYALARQDSLNDGSAQDLFIQQVGTTFQSREEAVDAYQDAAMAARAYLSLGQQAALKFADRNSDDARAVRAYLRGQEDIETDGRLSAPVRDELERLGMVEGSRSPSLIDGIGSQLAAWLDAKQRTEFLSEQDPNVASAMLMTNAEALFGINRPSTPPRGYRSVTRSQKFFERMGGAFSGKRFLSRAFTTLSRYAGVMTRNGRGAFLSPQASKAELEYFTRIKPLGEAQQHHLMLLTNNALSKLRLNNADLPPRLRTLFFDVHNSGEFMRMKSADQLARKYGEDARVLWEPLVQVTELLDQVGKEGVAQGWLTEEQFEGLRGKYVMQQYLDTQMDTMVEQLRKGDIGAIIPSRGRGMRRAQAGEVQRELLIKDPFVYMRSMAQESTANYFYGSLNSLLDEGIAVPVAELENADPWVKKDYEVFALDRSTSRRASNLDPVNGLPIQPRQVFNSSVLSDIRRRASAEAEDGALADGQTPLTPQLERMLDAFAPEDGAGVALPTHIAQDLNAWMRFTFDPVSDVGEGAGVIRGPYEALRNGTMGQYMLRKFDEVFRFWKGKSTVLNPSHWLLARVNDVRRNWVGGRLPTFDFASSLLFGRGYLADSIRAAWDSQTYDQLGRPDTLTEEMKTEGWTQARFEQAKLFRDFADLATGGTYVENMIETGSISDILGDMLDPDELTQRLVSQIGGLRGGVGKDTAADMVDAVSDWARRSAAGQQRVHHRMMQLLLDSDPANRAHAIKVWMAQYQLYELITKFAPTLRGVREMNMSLQDATTWAAEPTGDYRLANPVLRDVSRNLTMAGGDRWRELNGANPAKYLRFLIASPFWTFTHTTTAHDLSRIGSPQAWLSAAWGATAAAVMWRLMSEDPERREQWWQTASGSRQMPATTFVKKEDIRSALESFKKGGGSVFGGAAEHLPEEFVEVLIHATQGEPFTTKAPIVGPDSYLTDFTPLAPPWEMPVNMARSARAVVAGNPEDRARQLIDSLQGTLPTVGLATAALGLRMVNPQKGRSRAEQALSEVQRMSQEFAPGMYPGLWLLSRPGQHLAEQALLDGQYIGDWIEGNIPAYEPPGSERFMSASFRYLWRARRITLPRGELNSTDGVVRNIMSQTLGRVLGTRKSLGPEALNQYNAVRKFTDQWVNSTLKGEYAKWRNVENQPWQSFWHMLWDDQIAGVLARDLAPDSTDANLKLKPFDELTSDLTRFISTSDPTQQGHMLEFAAQFFRGPAFKNTGIPLIMDAAASRSLEPEMLTELYRSALSDPNGRGTIKAIYQRTLGDRDYERLEQMWPVFAMLPPPQETDVDIHKMWSELNDAYRGSIPQTKGKFPRKRPPVREVDPAQSFRSGPLGGTDMRGIRGGPTIQRFLEMQRNQR